MQEHIPKNEIPIVLKAVCKFLDTHHYGAAQSTLAKAKEAAAVNNFVA